MFLRLILCVVTMICSIMHAESWWQSYDLQKTAIVVKPFADLFVQSAQRSTRFKPATALYRHQALSCEPTLSISCTRAHQALFNEIMVDVRFEGNEVAGRLPNAVYGNDAYDPTIKKPLDLFYAHERSVVFLEELANHGVSLDCIPAPAWMKHVKQLTVTLMLPWIDAAQSQRAFSKRTFSMGTRFVRIPQDDTFTHYAITYLDFRTLTPVYSFVPKAVCVPEQLKKHPRALFVHILKSVLGAAQPGLIPYVWGGSSFVQAFPDKPYQLVTRTELNQAVSYYQRTPAHQTPSGFDCSELVWRVTQMAGLDYVFKNTGMLEQQGTLLGATERVQSGDLIWIRGHVMIAEDVVHNKLAEAAGYGAGFGKVQEIDLARRLYGISSYHELENAYRNHACLTLLNANGGNATSCKPFKLFKLIKD